MLITKLLRVKKFFTKSNGDTIIDLASTTYSFEKTGGPSAGTIRIGEDEAMRPDSVSIRIYGTHEFYESLMKYNGVSNPFAIYPGEIWLAPAFKTLDQAIVAPKEIVEKGKEKLSSNEEKLINPKTVKDKKRLAALKDKVKEIVPPNVNTSGNKNVKVRDGKVIFGEDVTSINKDNCPIPISRARLIQQLTKSNLF